MSAQDEQDLRTIRIALGLTPEEMAQAMGLRPGAYGVLEENRKPVGRLYLNAAERVALAHAVKARKPQVAPASVRRDAIELAWLMTK